MTTTEKFEFERAAIAEALAACATTVQYNKDEIPKVLPAGIVVLQSETGTKPTAKRYMDTDFAWTVYLIVNSLNVADPDLALFKMKEVFRSHYQTATGRDVPGMEYYSSRLDGARPVRVGKIELLRSGSRPGA